MCNWKQEFLYNANNVYVLFNERISCYLKTYNNLRSERVNNVIFNIHYVKSIQFVARE